MNLIILAYSLFRHFPVCRAVWPGRFFIPVNFSFFHLLFLFLVAMANGQRNENIRRKKFRLRFDDEESKTFIYLFIYSFLNYVILIISRLLHAILICIQVEYLRGHWLLFLSFISLKNEDNRHLTMGVDKTMNLFCAGKLNKRNLTVSWNSAISLIRFFPYTKRQTLLVERDFISVIFEWYKRKTRKKSF